MSPNPFSRRLFSRRHASSAPRASGRHEIVSILGAALIVGGGSLAAGYVSHRPDPVKPATGTAQALALASDRAANASEPR